MGDNTCYFFILIFTAPGQGPGSSASYHLKHSTVFGWTNFYHHLQRYCNAGAPYVSTQSVSHRQVPSAPSIFQVLETQSTGDKEVNARELTAVMQPLLP